MLSGQLSNQDEDEVEDELDSLEREIEGPKQEVNKPVHLPDAPVSIPHGHGKEEVLLHEDGSQEHQQQHGAVPLAS